MEREVKPLAYVAGAYSAPIKKQRMANVKLADAAGRELFDLGFAVVIPHNNIGEWRPTPGMLEFSMWRRVLDNDIEILMRCDVLVLLDNWKRSRGAREEVEVAIERGIPITMARDRSRVVLLLNGLKKGRHRV